MKKFICKAPWTSIAFQPSGKAGPCCVYELDELHDVNNNVDQIFQTEQQQFLNSSNDTLWQHFLIYNLMLDQTRQEKFFACLPIKSDLTNRWVHL
jgi:hypothetical protein